jgi:hypothetical protein
VEQQAATWCSALFVAEWSFAAATIVAVARGFRRKSVAVMSCITVGTVSLERRRRSAVAHSKARALRP